MCGCSLVQRTLIAVPFSWTLQIASPLQGNSSFSCLGMVIRRLSRFEPVLPSQGSGSSLILSIFPRLIVGVGYI